MWIDTQMYPHIMDLTMAHAPYGALVALRATSRSLKARTDVLFVRHVTLTNVEKNRGEDEDYAESEGGPFATFTVSTLHGRHPALLDWPHPGAGGVYAPCGSCIVTNLNGPGDVTCDKCEPDVPWRHTPTSILFKSTRVVDVVGATLMEAVKEFSSLFSALDMMRFQGAWGMDLDMEEKGWVWPKDMTRQTLMCPVRKLVWLGDIGQLSGQRCEAVPEVAGADYVYVFTCSPSLDLEIDFRLEALQSAGSLTVVYRLDNASSPGDVGSTSCAQAHQVEPYTDAVRHEHQPYPLLTVAGFFDLPLDLEPQNGESSAECFLSLARDALRKTARRGEMRDEEVDAVVVERLERVKTVSLDEYSRGLGAEERALILGGGHVVPR